MGQTHIVGVIVGPHHLGELAVVPACAVHIVAGHPEVGYRHHVIEGKSLDVEVEQRRTNNSVNARFGIFAFYEGTLVDILILGAYTYGKAVERAGIERGARNNLPEHARTYCGGIEVEGYAELGIVVHICFAVCELYCVFSAPGTAVGAPGEIVLGIKQTLGQKRKHAVLLRSVVIVGTAKAHALATVCGISGIAHVHVAGIDSLAYFLAESRIEFRYRHTYRVTRNLGGHGSRTVEIIGAGQLGHYGELAGRGEVGKLEREQTHAFAFALQRAEVDSAFHDICQLQAVCFKDRLLRVALGRGIGQFVVIARCHCQSSNTHKGYDREFLHYK